jgi:hypothetical protein
MKQHARLKTYLGSIYALALFDGKGYDIKKMLKMIQSALTSRAHRAWCIAARFKAIRIQEKNEKTQQP